MKVLWHLVSNHCNKESHDSYRGVGAKLKVVKENFMASFCKFCEKNWEISIISENSSVLKAVHAKGYGACPLGEF